MADTQTGDLFWLATLEVEDTAKYGPGHVRVASNYHADYAPAVHRVVYYDMMGHHLYLLDLNTGRREPLFTMKSGTIGDPPSIAADGSRVVFYAAQAGPAENEWYCGRTFTIFGLDVDAASGKAKGRPYVISSYAAQGQALRRESS